MKPIKRVGKPAPVTVSMMVRNEEAGLRDALESVRPYVEEIVIIDTGSTDSTVKIAKEYADHFKVYTDCNGADGNIVSFAQGRNAAMAMANKPWVMWLDGDDVVVGAEHIRDVVNDARNHIVHAVTAARIAMIYQLPGGMVNTRERLVCPVGQFEWRGAVHETLMQKEGVNFYQALAEKVSVRHQPKSEKRREEGRNIRILKHELSRKGFLEPREMFYMARECMDHREPAAAIRWFKNYVNVSIFPEEKSAAYVLLSELHLMRLEHSNAVRYALLAHATCEYLPEPIVQLSKCFYLQANRSEEAFDNFRRCAHFSKLAIEAAEKPHPTMLFVHPDRVRVEIYRYYNVALYRTGRIEEALAAVEIALTRVPEDVQFLQNKKFYLETLGRSVDNASASETTAPTTLVPIEDKVHELSP